MSPARPSHPDGRAFLRACPLAAWRPAPAVWLHIAAPPLSSYAPQRLRLVCPSYTPRRLHLVRPSYAPPDPTLRAFWSVHASLRAHQRVTLHGECRGPAGDDRGSRHLCLKLAAQRHLVAASMPDSLYPIDVNGCQLAKVCLRAWGRQQEGRNPHEGLVVARNAKDLEHVVEQGRVQDVLEREPQYAGPRDGYGGIWRWA